MKQDHTHIAAILDCSGSMESTLENTIGGFTPSRATAGGTMDFRPARNQKMEFEERDRGDPDEEKKPQG